MHAFRKCLESIFNFFGQFGHQATIFYAKNRLTDGELLISKISDKKVYFKNFPLWFLTNLGNFSAGWWLLPGYKVMNKHCWYLFPDSLSLFVIQKAHYRLFWWVLVGILSHTMVFYVLKWEHLYFFRIRICFFVLVVVDQPFVLCRDATWFFLTRHQSIFQNASMMTRIEF